MNRSGDVIDGVDAILADGLAGRAAGLACVSDDGESHGADTGQGPRVGANVAAVHVHGDVADVMPLVLDGPMSTIERERRAGLAGGQAGDEA